MSFHWRGLNIVPHTRINFMHLRFIAFVFALGIISVTAISLWIQGLNYGVDFKGGVLMEIQTQGPADLKSLREKVSSLGLGDATLQTFGDENQVLIRLGMQEGGEKGQMEAVTKVHDALGADVSFRRVETVGPKMGAELVKNSIYAVMWCMGAMLVYIWIRFEWQFALCAILALTHDAIAVIGLYTIGQLEFNSQAIVAILITVGYSINDTVVIYDRIRENLRKFRTMPLYELLNLSINETLSRTILTSFTTLLALFALYLLGGEVIADYALPIIAGVAVGTISSIFLSAPLLLFFHIRRRDSLPNKS